MTEYSRMAKGNYTVASGTLGVSAPPVKIINLPFKPDYVELINYTQSITPGPHGIPFAFWDASTFVTVSGTVYNPTIIDIFNGTPVLTTDSVLTNGISVFSAGLSQQFGPSQQIVSATAASPAVFTVTGHGYQVGDTVVFSGLYQTATTGMPQMAGIPFTITAVTANTFTVNWNASGSNYTALSGSPVGALVRKVLYPFLYVPEDNVVSAITLGATTTIQTTMYHNFETGQEIAFRIPTVWGTYQLNSLPNVVIPGSPIYGYVVSVTDNWTFVCNINSTGYTAYNPNQTVASVSGLTFPQVLSVGDVNTGGLAITAGSALYPSPSYPTSTNRVPTINGPAIRGAFVNNTSQGFIVGAGASHTDTTSWVGGSSGDVIEWRAYYHDLSIP
jgi:hypothetical protein